ncbi:glycoside hydrolase family 79 protein [Mycena rebaudengoi]|nr:glycoside hydrolase family 79 protein [Mycena rebaudengoi]
MFPSLWFISALPIVSGISVSIPLSAHIHSPALSGNLFSFSIEQDRWLDWIGNTSRNSFFFNALDNLVALSGSNTTLRIGGNSADHTHFNPAVEFVEQVFPSPTKAFPYPEATNVVVGPGFYESAKFLPNGTGVIWGVNFGGKNLTAVFLETKAIASAFSSPAFVDASISLDSLELGNEADLYKNNKLRASHYNVSQYTTEWIHFATNMTRTANLSGSDTRIWGAGFVGASHSPKGFSPQGIFKNKILDSEPGSFVTTISQHHYSGSFCTGSSGLLQDLMTKSTIRSNLSIFTPDIEVTRAHGLDYVLGETNSYSCHGTPGVSNTAGAALWTLDYGLFAAQLGISKLFFHEGIGYKYNFIQPTALTRSTLDGSPLPMPQQPQVQPPYYAAIVASEAIGHYKHKHRQSIELNVKNAHISGYAFYEARALKRALFINSQAFFQGATDSNRTSVHLDLTFAGTGRKPRTFSVKRLVIGHTDDVSGLTWGGLTYETSDARAAGNATTENGTVSAGVSIRATEAVLISFD